MVFYPSASDPCIYVGGWFLHWSLCGWHDVGWSQDQHMGKVKDSLSQRFDIKDEYYIYFLESL